MKYKYTYRLLNQVKRMRYLNFILATDLGGTNTRLALYKTGGGGGSGGEEGDDNDASNNLFSYSVSYGSRRSKKPYIVAIITFFVRKLLRPFLKRFFFFSTGRRPRPGRNRAKTRFARTRGRRRCVGGTRYYSCDVFGCTGGFGGEGTCCESCIISTSDPVLLYPTPSNILCARQSQLSIPTTIQHR